MDEITPECIGSQTIGPYYAIGLSHLVTQTIAGDTVAGEHVTITGVISDGNGDPIPDAILEFWQASADGRYNREEAFVVEPRSPDFAGFARLSTHNDGRFEVSTIKPGPVTYIDGREQAPHIVVLVFMRGLLIHLVTRMYFPDPRVASDPILSLVPADRRSTLLAKPVEGQPSVLQWNICMQGKNETVFFDC